MRDQDVNTEFSEQSLLLGSGGRGAVGRGAVGRGVGGRGVGGRVMGNVPSVPVKTEIIVNKSFPTAHAQTYPSRSLPPNLSARPPAPARYRSNWISLELHRSNGHPAIGCGETSSL